MLGMNPFGSIWVHYSLQTAPWSRMTSDIKSVTLLIYFDISLWYRAKTVSSIYLIWYVKQCSMYFKQKPYPSELWEIITTNDTSILQFFPQSSCLVSLHLGCHLSLSKQWRAVANVFNSKVTATSDSVKSNSRFLCRPVHSFARLYRKLDENGRITL